MSVHDYYARTQLEEKYHANHLFICLWRAEDTG